MAETLINLPSPLGGKPPKGSYPSFTDYDYELKYRRAFELVLWSIPAVEVYGFARGIKAVGGGPNVVLTWSKLATPKAELLTANNTTPYIFAMTDLREGPVVIDVPAATEKASLYGQIVDHWQMAIGDVGPGGLDKGKGGKYLLVPPDYEEDVPEGYFVLNSPSYRVYFVFRSIRGKGASVEDAYQYAKTMKMYYLKDPKPTTFIDPADMRFPSLARFDERWFEDLYEVFSVEKIKPEDKIMMFYLSTLGIEKGKPFNPDEQTVKAMRQAAIDAYHYLHHRATYAEEARVYWPDRHWLNILVPDKNGLFSFVYDDMIDIDRRAEMRYLGTFYPRGLPKTPATMYLYTFVDKDGEPIEPGKTYKLSVPADVLLNSFGHSLFMTWRQWRLSTLMKERLASRPTNCLN